MIFPKPTKTLLQLLGPSIVFVALSLGGGEILLWPSLTANYGLRILWPLLIILTLQFIVNIEIERYTLATGKSTEANLTQNVRWLSVVFIVAVLVSLVWPAWMSTAGNILATLALPGAETGQIRNAGLVLTIMLMLLVTIVFVMKNTYKILEWVSRIGLIFALVIIAIVMVLNFDAGILLEALRGVVSFGYLPMTLSRFDFLAAVGYGGVAGVLNLVQSEWIASKKYGAAGLSAQDSAAIDWTAEESRSNFRHWFRLINQEHFLLFFFANLFTIFLVSYLGALLLPVGTAQGFVVLQEEIAILNTQVPYLGVAFGAATFVIFVMANVAILDALGRLTHRALETNSARLAKILQPNRISLIALAIGVGVLGLSIVNDNFKQPYFLLVLSASLSALVMWLYPPLLLKLNLQLPEAVRPKLWRQIGIGLCTVFYGGVGLWALSSLFPFWSVVVLGVVVTSYQLYFVFFKK
jgi:hypothetical protein